jgi:hypothetical protein
MFLFVGTYKVLPEMVGVAMILLFSRGERKTILAPVGWL